MIIIDNENCIRVRYDNLPEEVASGFNMFQNKYLLKRKIIYTIVYGIAAALGLNLILTNPSGIAGYVLTGLSAALVAVNWLQPVFKLRKMLNVWRQLNDETYIASFYSDRIEIETDFQAKKDLPSENVSVSAFGVNKIEKGSKMENDMLSHDENSFLDAKPQITVLNFSETVIDAKITDKLILLFVNRSYIYIIPKRCLSSDERQALTLYLNDKSLV